MRTFDVGVGRVAAVAGIVYVALASLWPLSASAGDDGIDSRARIVCDADAGADRQSPTTARGSEPATCADEPDAPTSALLVVSFATVALMALLSRSDAMTARFYTDVG